MYWLRNQTATYDEKAMVKGTEANVPFPDLKYFDYLWAAMVKCDSLFIPKTREMMTSWEVAGFMAHVAQYNPHSLCIVQTQNETKAKKLLTYSKALYDNQPEWLRRMHPLAGGDLLSTDASQSNLLAAYQNGAKIIGVPGGAHQIRLYHPTVMVFDELAHLIEARESFGTARPVSAKLFGVSSAGPGFMAEMCDEDLMDPDAEEEVRALFADVA